MIPKHPIYPWRCDAEALRAAMAKSDDPEVRWWCEEYLRTGASPPLGTPERIRAVSWLIKSLRASADADGEGRMNASSGGGWRITHLTDRVVELRKEDGE